MTELTKETYGQNDTESECFDLNAQLTDEYLESCNCPIECQTDEYTWDHSFGEILDPDLKNHTGFSVYFSEMRETVISEEKKTEITNLVATVGGIMGLFTGFNFLSWMEIFEIIFQIAMILFKRNEIH